MSRQGQLVLPFAPHASRARADFIAGPSNRAALDLLEAWPDGWPARTQLLVGAPGSGKTHLAAIWAGRSKAWPVDWSAIDPASATSAPEGTAFLLEKGSEPCAETSLFHLLNAVQAGRHWLLLTATTPVEQWGIGLPDLLSRLKNMPHIDIGDPDDALLEAILFKHLSERQLAAEPEVLRYMLQRMERSPAAARALAHRLDELALLEKKRSISKVLAARALERMGETG